MRITRRFLLYDTIINMYQSRVWTYTTRTLIKAYVRLRGSFLRFVPRPIEERTIKIIEMLVDFERRSVRIRGFYGEPPDSA